MTTKTSPRRFPAPWRAVDVAPPAGSCFQVQDATGFVITRLYYDDERSRRDAANLFTRDEARRLAVNIARLPGLLAQSAACGDVED